MKYDYDLFVIGAGSGGVRASRISAGFGARVAIAEEHRIGGTCVIRGCIPKKYLVYASHFSEELNIAQDYGWNIENKSFNWQTLIERKDHEIDRLNKLYIQTLGKTGVTMMQGRAVLTGPNSVQIDDKHYTAERILIAVGGWPHMPDVPGIEHAISSNEALHLEQLPETIVIVGGGYIAVEFAGIFAGLGSKVTLIYRGKQILRGFDEDLSIQLTKEMRAKGIDVRTETNVSAIKKFDHDTLITLTDGSELVVNSVMYATGRKPKTKGLGLDKAGVELARNGAIKVNTYSQTNVPNIFAVGDVTDRVQLTPVAIKEGHAFALTTYGNTPTSPDHDAIPSAIFSQPPIGTVGLSEADAIAAGHPVDIYESDFKPMKYTLGNFIEHTYIKLVVHAETDVVLGAHIIGLDAAEIIQGIGIAVKAQLTKAQFDATIAVHPTSAEEFVLMRAKRA